MIALVDCNNFYASCERLFRPDLRHKPIIVLSNNDGCVVARSDESKALGIPMGVPFFEVRELVGRHQIEVFSSNYTLYGDISRRVMEVIGERCPEVEVYSIDEAFVDFSVFSGDIWEEKAIELRQVIWDKVGIPVSVGLGQTKTLAKLANHLVKKRKLSQLWLGEGVAVISTVQDRHEALRTVQVGDVWGIGRVSVGKLQSEGIHTAFDFIQCSSQWIRQHFTITGWRTWRELQGHHELPFNPAPPIPQSVVFSRSLSECLWSSKRIQQRVKIFTQSFAEKLRHKQVYASQVSLVLSGGYGERHNLGKRNRHLLVPSNDTRILLVEFEQMCTEILSSNPFGVQRITLVATELVSTNVQQLSLFQAPTNHSMMQLLDRINQKFGRGTMRVGVTPKEMKHLHGHQRFRSPRYTTRWSEIPVVDISKRYSVLSEK